MGMGHPFARGDLARIAPRRGVAWAVAVMRVFSATLVGAATLFVFASLVDDGRAATESKRITCLATEDTPARTCVALVIGNSDYTHGAGRLPNALNDGRAISEKLTELGFEVTLAENLASKPFAQTIGAFVTRAKGADVALFFYGGHALQLEGINYLMPTDAALASALEAKQETIAAQDVVALMEGAARMNLIFLDACRSNPLAEQLKTSLAATGRSGAIGRGLSRIEAKEKDTLIVYATEPGQEALDGVGGADHSPFVAGMLTHMDTPGLEIDIMVRRVTTTVREESQGKQKPERLSKLESEFYFRPAVAAPSPQPDRTVMPVKPPIAEETRMPSSGEAERAWDRIKDTENAEIVKGFQAQFGRSNPYYDGLATDKLESLERKIREADTERRQSALFEEQRKKERAQVEQRVLSLEDRRQLSEIARQWPELTDLVDRRIAALDATSHASVSPLSTDEDDALIAAKWRVLSLEDRRQLSEIARQWPELRDLVERRIAALDRQGGGRRRSKR